MPSVNNSSSSARHEATMKSVDREVRQVRISDISNSSSSSSSSNAPSSSSSGSSNLVKLSQLFGQNVYSLKEMQRTLPKPVYANVVQQMSGNKTLDKSSADAVAHAVKVWAIERGATHFTHWFQPQTNHTAEKHDSFLSLKYNLDGNMVTVTPLETFSGSQLLQAEPDASSFPHGGARTTFEARGYTVWDTSSPMFLQDGPHNTKVLYIPSVFISYNGEALDEKTILLRSCESVNVATKDLLRLLGNDTVTKVHTTLGTEQEFFLIDRNHHALRLDLKMTGRTLLGAVPPKHQQLEDHYFGSMPDHVLAAISEAELELWKLGVPVKTRHNEVAPQQFEIAPIFEEAGVAVDHNMLTMEVLDRVARRHHLRALFHEKPFAGVNGSGKHCNWALSTDHGENLLDPTAKPEENHQFLLILVSILQGLKEHSGLLRAAIASCSNEHRLGANEAPPSIISAFLGEQLNEVLDSIEQNRPMCQKVKPRFQAVNLGGNSIDLKVSTLPDINRDSTDRNRTSPMAFTGNKFEFRAVGSSQSPSFPVTMLNAIAAAGLKEITAALVAQKGSKAALSSEDITAVLRKYIASTRAVRFEGNGYSAEWALEAEKRGLLNIRTAPEAFMQLTAPHNAKMLKETLAVVTASELDARYHVLCEKYSKDMVIEAKTFIQIARQTLIPAVFKYRRDLSAGVAALMSISSPSESSAAIPEKVSISKLGVLAESLDSCLLRLEGEVKKVEAIEDDAVESARAAVAIAELLIGCRKPADSIEEILADEYYPLPKYTEILFN
jgi:glutamine synthetase